MLIPGGNQNGRDEATADGADRQGSAYGAAVDEALRLAWDEPGVSRAEVLALELLKALGDERRQGERAGNAGVVSPDETVVDLRDHAGGPPPEGLPVWEYDPPAWLDADRVQPLPGSYAGAGSAWPPGPSAGTATDGNGAVDLVRDAHSSVRLPFGAIVEEDYERLDRLRGPDRGR